VAGLGGADITPEVINDVFDRTMRAPEPPPEPIWIGILPDHEPQAQEARA
jgi:hypothetical protein